MTDLFPAFPDNARLWIYAAERPLGSDDQATLLNTLANFFAGWASHGRTVRGAATIHADRFVLLAATLVEGDISGCGIDASVHAVEAAFAQQGIGLMEGLKVLFRDDAGAIVAASRKDFRQLVRAGTVSAETLVFDLTLTTVGALRAGGFERPAGATWHARVFRIPQPA